MQRKYFILIKVIIVLGYIFILTLSSCLSFISSNTTGLANTIWSIPPIWNNHGHTINLKFGRNMSGSNPFNNGTWSQNGNNIVFELFAFNGGTKIKFEGKYFLKYQRIIGNFIRQNTRNISDSSAPKTITLVPSKAFGNHVNYSGIGLKQNELAELLNVEYFENNNYYRITLDTYSNVYGSLDFVYEFINEFAKENNIQVFHEQKVKSPIYRNKMDLGLDFLLQETFDTYDVLLVIGKSSERGIALVCFDAANSTYFAEIYNIRYRRN